MPVDPVERQSKILDKHYENLEYWQKAIDFQNIKRNSLDPDPEKNSLYDKMKFKNRLKNRNASLGHSNAGLNGINHLNERSTSCLLAPVSKK